MKTITLETPILFTDNVTVYVDPKTNEFVIDNGTKKIRLEPEA